jgi:septal ring factor EnvC (AmiA/AmiB activator)
MARIVALAVTVIALLATCYFGYATRNKILGLNDQITALNGTVAQLQQKIAKAQADLKSTQEELAQTKKDLDDTKTQLATTQGSLDAANAQVAQLTDKNKELQAKIDQMSTHTPDQIASSGPSQADYDAEVKKATVLQTQVNELNTLKDTLSKQLKDTESHADDLQKVVDHYKNGTIKNGLEGEVLAFNPGWNFVVLSIGDHAGAVANAELILKRGDAQIGKVRITSVEPSTSVADIVPGSLTRGVRVQPGDRVIYQGFTGN